MIVTAIARTKNEADIVEPFVRHTLCHVDRMFVQDNSEDETGEILAALKAEGLPLEILTETIVGDRQAMNATILMNHVAQFSDWVVPLDADEFICGHDRLADVLASRPPNVFIHRWRTYVWNQSMTGWPEMSFRLKTEANPNWHKAIVPKHIASTGELPKGAHYVKGHRELYDAGLHLAHYPIRSPDQWALKALLHHAQETMINWSLLLPPDSHPAIKELLTEGRVSSETAAAISRTYFADAPPGWTPELVVDPLPYRGGALRYTKPVNFNRTLARFLLKVARAIGDTTKERK